MTHAARPRSLARPRPGRAGRGGARGHRLPEGLVRAPAAAPSQRRPGARLARGRSGVTHPPRRRHLHRGRGDRAPGDPRGPAALAAAEAPAARGGGLPRAGPRSSRTWRPWPRVPRGPGRSRGASGRSETTLVSLWGDVRRPGVYEVPLGTPLRADHRGARRRGAPDGVSPASSPAGPPPPPLLADAARHAARSRRAARGGLRPRHRRRARGGRARLPARVAVVPGRASSSGSPAASARPARAGTASLHRIARAAGAEAKPGRRTWPTSARWRASCPCHGYCAHCRAAAVALTRLLARPPTRRRRPWRRRARAATRARAITTPSPPDRPSAKRSRRLLATHDRRLLPVPAPRVGSGSWRALLPRAPTARASASSSSARPRPRS